MNTKNSTVLLAVILFVAIPASTAPAALYNDPVAIVADQVVFSDSTFYGYVDYAVYAPGDYVGSLSFPDEYVYCFQIFNDPTSAAIRSFTVNLDLDAIVYNATYDAASSSGVSGGTNPGDSSILSDSIAYSFSRNTILANQHSSVVLFTSYSSPTSGTGFIADPRVSDITIQLPVPIPEPATLLLFVFAVPLLVKKTHITPCRIKKAGS